MKVAEAWRFPELCKQVKRKCALLFQQKLRALLQEYLVTGEECSNSAEKQKRDTSRGVPKCSNTRVTRAPACGARKRYGSRASRRIYCLRFFPCCAACRKHFEFAYHTFQFVNQSARARLLEHVHQLPVIARRSLFASLKTVKHFVAFRAVIRKNFARIGQLIRRRNQAHIS